MATVALVSTATPSVDGRGRRLGTARSRTGGGPLPESVATPTAGCAHPRNAGLPLCPGGPRRGARGLCSWDSAPALTGTRRRCIERLHIFYRCRRFLSMPALSIDAGAFYRCRRYRHALDPLAVVTSITRPLVPRESRTCPTTRSVLRCCPSAPIAIRALDAATSGGSSPAQAVDSRSR